MKIDGTTETNDINDRIKSVRIREGLWRFRKRRGTVTATLPVTSHAIFCELAILEDPGLETPRFAARARGTDDWVHYYHLQAWMYQIVLEYVMAHEKTERLRSLIGLASMALEGEEKK